MLLPVSILLTGRNALENAKKEVIVETYITSDRIFAVAASDPALTTVPDEHKSLHLKAGQRYTTDNFERLYQRRTDTDESNLLDLPTEFHIDDIDAVLQLQNELDIHLGSMCWKHGTTLGEMVQVDILSFLDRVEAVLREAFELTRVEESVRKRTRGMFETKTERA